VVDLGKEGGALGAEVPLLPVGVYLAIC